MFADFDPMPKMYVRAMTTRFSFGISTPAIRTVDRSPFLAGPPCARRPRGRHATVALALPLLVSLVLADDAKHAFTPDELAIRTDLLD